MLVAFTCKSIVSCPFSSSTHDCQERDATSGLFCHELDGGMDLIQVFSLQARLTMVSNGKDDINISPPNEGPDAVWHCPKAFF